MLLHPRRYTAAVAATAAGQQLALLLELALVLLG
eukprot:COSAG06_NODE_20067_length_810_cov_1.059072_1_plen_33_part_10